MLDYITRVTGQEGLTPALFYLAPLSLWRQKPDPVFWRLSAYEAFLLYHKALVSLLTIYLHTNAAEEQIRPCRTPLWKEQFLETITWLEVLSSLGVPVYLPRGLKDHIRRPPLGILFEQLHEIAEHLKVTVGECRLHLPRYETCAAPRWVYRPVSAIVNLLDRVCDQIVSVILFGSLSTGDFVPNFSDVDILVIIKSPTLSSFSPGRLKRAFASCTNALLSRVPIVTHRLFVVTEDTISLYPQTIMPFPALFRGKILRGRTNISFRYVPDEYYSSFWLMASQTLRFCTRRLSMSWSTCYRLLHSVLLLPTLFIQAVEDFVYKKDSFTRINRYLDEKTRAALSWAEKMRLNWPTWPYWAYSLASRGEVPRVIASRLLGKVPHPQSSQFLRMLPGVKSLVTRLCDIVLVQMQRRQWYARW